MDDPEPPPDAVHEEPRRFIDQRPTHWLVIVLLLLCVALAAYVIMSAVGVEDQRALIAAGLAFVINGALVCGLKFMYRRRRRRLTTNDEEETSV